MYARILLLPPQAILAIVASLLLSSCTHTYEMKVAALSKPKATEAASYRIHTKGAQADDVTLRQKEAEKFVKTALSGKGMYEAPDDKSADMIVDIDYGIEPPRVRYERSSRPVFAQVGGGVSYQTIAVGIDSKGNPVYRTVAIYEPPRTEIIGYEEIVIPVVVYEKYLTIVAYENQPVVEGRPPEDIWSVKVSSEDESKDLRKYLPVLASVSINHIGTNSNSQKTVKIREDDESVSFVRKGM